MTIEVYDQKLFDRIAAQGKRSNRKRASHNLHSSYSDPCQKLFNVINKHSYIRPHKHVGAYSDETMICVKGSFILFVFNDEGQVMSVSPFGAAGFDTFGIKIPPGYWHTLIALEDNSMILECKAGPFDVNIPKIFAHWSPCEGTSESIIFLKKLYDLYANGLIK